MKMPVNMIFIIYVKIYALTLKIMIENVQL